jgi:LAS superfamily LD-carboxypeptidase LdcB
MRSPEAEAQLAQIRAEIQRYGQSIVGCDQLLRLVSKDDPIQAQFGHIFLTAERERWSFEFRTDGTVRFADLDSTGEQLEEWNGPSPNFVHAAEA